MQEAKQEYHFKITLPEELYYYTSELDNNKKISPSDS